MRSLVVVLSLILAAARSQESADPLTTKQEKLEVMEAKLAKQQELLADQTDSDNNVNNNEASSPPLLPVESPTEEDITNFMAAHKKTHPKWETSGAPHNLLSWKYPVDYLIDPDPMRVDGDLIPVTKRIQSVPTGAATSGPDAPQAGPIGAENRGITVSVWNPGWPLNAQQLRMIGLAINQVGGDHPELPMNSGTRCFCRVVAPIPRCACQNGETPQIPSKAKEMESALRDIETNAVRAIVLLKYKAHVYEHRPTVFTPRIVEHRKASNNLRSKRVTGEWQDKVHELAHELAHPSIADPSIVLSRVHLGDVACIDSHWCVRDDDDKQQWRASTKVLAAQANKTEGANAGWCVGVGRLISVDSTGTACVHYESVHTSYVGDGSDYHLPVRIPGAMNSNSHIHTAVNVKEECGVELRWMTTNCSDATQVRQREEKVSEQAQKDHERHRIQVQQAAVLTQHEVEHTTQVLKLLRDETLERAKEYKRIQRETKERNDKTIVKMKEEAIKAEILANDEVQRNETEGIRNITLAQNEGKTALEAHRAKVAKVLAYQKKVADDRVRTWKDRVTSLKNDVAREKRVPVEEIESRVTEIVERKAETERMQHELVRQQQELSTQQETAMELMTIQDKEDEDERNETKTLQITLDASYDRTRKSIAKDRKHRLKLEEENAKRRMLPPIPRPQPFRPTPQCGPTPGWLLTPDEQDDEILRCMRPLKGNPEVEETSQFIASIFGGGTGKAPGAGSTITEGCLRMGINVSYIDVLQRIKAREDQEDDKKHLHLNTNQGPRPSIIDPSRNEPLNSGTRDDTLQEEQSGNLGRNPSSSSAVGFLETSQKNRARSSRSRSSNNNITSTSTISEASELLGRSVNNTIRKYGPPDEVGKYAMIPRGHANFVALKQTTECLCEVATTEEGRGGFNTARHHTPLGTNGGGCIDDLDGANGMINMQWRSVVRSRINKLEHELELARRRPREERKRPHTAPPDVAAMVKRIHVQKESLKTATQTLNEELDRRWSRGPTIHGNPAYVINPDNQHLTPNPAAINDDVAAGDGMRFQTKKATAAAAAHGVGAAEDHSASLQPDVSSSGFAPVTDGSCGSTLYKAWEQIKILEEEIDKLREDLRKCRAEPTK